MSMEELGVPAFRPVARNAVEIKTNAEADIDRAVAAAASEAANVPPRREPIRLGAPGASAEPSPPPWTGAATPPGGFMPPLSELDFAVHVSMRYHMRRRAWYDRLHRAMMLVVTAGGSAGVAAIFGGLILEAEYLAAAVAAAGVVELAFALPERARLEDALYRRFNALAYEMASAKTDDDERRHTWDAERVSILADADDRYEALRRVCHNLEADARGLPYPAAYYRVWPWQRLLAQMISLPPLHPLRAHR